MVDKNKDLLKQKREDVTLLRNLAAMVVGVGVPINTVLWKTHHYKRALFTAILTGIALLMSFGFAMWAKILYKKEEERKNNAIS